jgi:polysaccharide chain length determinant protein (PEP-CTERM system associated)
MTEIVEEQKSEQLDVRRFFDLARRRHMHFLIPLLIGWLVVWGLSWILPASYKSNTLILVQQPTMPQNYVLPNVNDDLQARMQSITQQILSRTRLLMIIDKLHLYGGKDGPGTDDEKVAAMRKDIDVELVRDTTHNQEITAFRIFYSARNPYVAQQVTSELTDLFISENQKVLEQESQGTTTFLGDQLDVARQSLAQQEAKVKQFEAMHEGVLPSQQQSNLQILAGLQQQLQNEQDALNAAKQQGVYYQSMVDEYRTLHGSSRGADPALAELPSLDQEITRLRGQLSDLRSRYTEQYPDVVKTKDQLATAQKNRADLIAQIRANAANSKATDSDEASNEPPDPTQSGPLLQMQGQVKANRAEIANRERAIQQLQARIGDYSGRLNAEPGIEQQLADLTRGYDQSKAIYDDLLKKKTQSSMATSMEELQQGERFTILDPPSLPTKPDFPNRLKFCGFGLVAGLVLGIGFVGGFEFFDDRLYDEKEIKGMLPFAVISEVPEIRDAATETHIKRRSRLGWAMAVIAFCSILAGSVVSILLG